MNILNGILNAVSNGLDAIWPDIPISSEEITNDLPDRCFLIGFAGEASINKELGDRYRVSGQLDIAYYSPKESEAQQQELNQVFATAALQLRYVAWRETAITLTGHRKQTVDGVLHILCSFITFLYQQDGTPAMSTFKIDEMSVK